MFEATTGKVRALKKLLLTVGCAAAAGAAALGVGLGTGHADPSGNSTYNVVGEPYAKAVAILRSQGVNVPACCWDGAASSWSCRYLRRLPLPLPA